MTLKTGLLITGDASGAVKATGELAAGLGTVSAAATGAKAPLQQTAQAQAALTGTAREASGAERDLGQATAQAAEQARAASAASAALAKAQRDAGAAAAEASRQQRLAEKAANDNAKAANRAAFGARNLGQQFGDLGLQISAGISPARAFGQQAGQIGYALSEMSGKAKAVGTFLTGPWGIALTIASAIAAPYIEKLFASSSALADEVNELKKNAEATAVTARAKEEFRHSIEGVTAAIEADTAATKKSTAVERTAAEQQNVATRQHLAEAVAIRDKTRSRLEDAKELLQAQIRRSTVGGQQSEVATLGLGRAQAEVAEIDRQLADQSAKIVEQQQNVERSRLALAADEAKGVTDAVAGINKRFDLEAARITARKNQEIAAGVQIGAETKRQFEDIERRRKVALDAEEERQRSKPKSRTASIGSEVESDRSAQLLRDAQRYTGLSENRAADRDQLSALFAKANVNVDPRMVAWCAAFVNAVLATDGITGTGSLSARSFLNFGEATAKPNKGDIVVSSRGNDPAQGHVGFYQGTDAKGRVLVLGGNTGNRVGTQAIDRNSVLGFRRAPTPADQFVTEQKTAADALKQQAQDLTEVTSRYLPATQAAKDYADELQRINQLAASYDPKKEGSGLSPELAAQARKAIADARDKRLAEINATPESKAADDAKKSIDGLITSLKEEIAVRQAANPIEAAMIAHRKELADLAKIDPAAAAAREAELRGTLAQKEATDAVADATREAARAQEQFRNLAIDALDAVLVRGEKAGDVIKRLAQTIASAALEAAVFGSGPLAALLKAPGPGATPGAKNGGLVQAQADTVAKTLAQKVGEKLDTVLGKGGTAKALQNAGFGYTAASITGGSGVGGSIGGAAGGKIAEKFLKGALGDLAGPLGAIAGGILGGIVGKLFAPKAQPGGVTISASGGEAAIGGKVGSDKAGQSAGSSLGGQVASTINQIVSQLGGTIGDFSVQIGKYKDDLRVNVNGKALGGVKGSGATGFGDDQNAAVAFAVSQIIAQGAVQGVSAAIAKALKSSPDIDKALKEALKVQDIELLVGGIGAEIDKAFRDFQATAKERVRIATEYGFDVAAIEKRNAEDRVKLAAALAKKQVGALQTLIDEITQGSLFEGTAIDKIAALNTAIDKARVDLAANVEGAGDSLANLLSQRLSASKDAYGTTSGYAADRSATISEATAAVARVNAQITAAQAKSDPAIAETNKALDENNDQNAVMIDALKEQNALLTQLLNKGTGAGIGFDLSGLAST